MKLTIQLGDNLDLLKTYPDNYFDSVVTDCPYGLGKEPNALKLMQDWIDHGYHEIKGKGFMGKSWDAFVPQPLFWKEVFRVLKPGGYVLAFFGTRTYDWGTLAIRLAGFEIRDMITYHYGSGFPKSLNIKKSANDKCCQCTEMANRQESEYDLCNLPKQNLQETFSDKNTNSDILQSSVQESIENGKESGLERRDNHIQEKGELYQREVCESTGMGETNGEEGRVYNGTSINNGNPNKEAINQDGSSSSHRPQSNKQQPNKSTSLPEQQYSQESGTREICDVCGKPIIDGGIGTALKPATEPICVARKPIEGTVAENVLKYGTGGINLDACAIGDDLIISNAKQKSESFTSVGNGQGYNGKDETYNRGRFPANVIYDPFMADELDKQTGELTSGTKKPEHNLKSDQNGHKVNNVFGKYNAIKQPLILGDTGGASRFFYCAKASQFERNAMLLGCGIGSEYNDIQVSNFHPTVKPISLMSYLQRLVTPKGGKTLDPFAGSGTSGCSAYFENIGEIVLMEMDETYLPIIEARTAYWSIAYNRRKYLEDLKDPAKQPENQLKLFSA